jgi:hypothetical protein
MLMPPPEPDDELDSPPHAASSAAIEMSGRRVRKKRGLGMAGTNLGVTSIRS